MTRLGPVFTGLNRLLVLVLASFFTVFQSLVLQAIYSSATFLPGRKPVVNCVTPKRGKSSGKKWILSSPFLLYLIFVDFLETTETIV